MKKILLSLSLSSCLGVAFAQWSVVQQEDDTICVHDSIQYQHMMVSDGRDGAIIFWTDDRNGNHDIYAQCINKYGYLQWAANGAPMITGTDDQNTPVAIKDNNYGAIVATRNYTTQQCSLQHTDSAGNTLWGTNGVLIPKLLATDTQDNVALTNDTGNGAAVAVEYSVLGGVTHIMANRVSSNSNFLWGNGLAIDTVHEARAPQIVSTPGQGGSIIVWYYLSGSYPLLAQQVSGTGVINWASDAIVSGSVQNNYPSFNVTSDGNGGAVIVWQSASGDIYAQHVTTDGTLDMGPDGVVLCNATGTQSLPKVVRTTDGDYIAVWSDGRGGTWDYIFAQKFDDQGNILWTPNGVKVSDLNTYIPSPAIAPDLKKGAYITWIGTQSGSWQVYAHHIKKDSTFYWSAPLQVFADSHSPFYDQQIISTSDSAAICSINTYAGASISDIYAKKITPSGTFGCMMPSPVISSNSGILYAGASGMSYQWYLGGNLIPGATSYSYTPVANGQYTVTVSDGPNCQATSSQYTFTEIGIAEISSSYWSVFPNPFDNVVSITSLTNMLLLSVNVYDEAGKCVKTFTPSEPSDQMQLLLNDLAPGIYILKMISSAGCNYARIVKK